MCLHVLLPTPADKQADKLYGGIPVFASYIKNGLSKQ